MRGEALHVLLISLIETHPIDLDKAGHKILPQG
jgi:hypothetical protein